MIIIKAEKWTKFNYYRRLNNTVIVPAMQRIGEKKAAENINSCGGFVTKIQCTKCNTNHFGGFRTCKNRWCLNCQHKRLVCWVAKLIPIFEAWYNEGNYISNLNFTVRDGISLADTLSFLENSYRKLYNSEGKNRDYWHYRFPGGIKSLEIKLGSSSGLWHPHYHCLVMQRSDDVFVKDYDWLSFEWHNIVGFKTSNIHLFCDNSELEIVDTRYRKDGTIDYNWNGNVFIKKVSKYQKSNVKNGVSGHLTGILGAICETLKYIIKVDENLESDNNSIYTNDDLFLEAYSNLKGKRQVSTWGLLYGLSKKVDEAFDKEDYQQLKEFVCQKCGCTEGVLMEILYKTISEDTILYDINKVYKKRAAKKVSAAKK